MAKKKKVLVKKDKPKARLVPDELYSKISTQIEDAIDATTTWRDNQEKWHNLRMRIKKDKTFPFVGCANLRLPTLETKLRKVKSQLVKIIFGMRPIVQAVPAPGGNLEVAAKIEKFLDHLLMDVMKFKPKAIIGIDQTIEKGFYGYKPYWRVDINSTTETIDLKDFGVTPEQVASIPRQALVEMVTKSLDVDMSDLVAEGNTNAINAAIDKVLKGETSVKVKLDDVLYNYPDIALINPEFTYVPPDTGYDPQKSRLLCFDLFLPYDEVKRNVETKGWLQSGVDQIEEGRQLDRDNSTEISKDTREGIDLINNPSQLVRIYEVYMYYDLDKDGYEEKCVFTFAPDFGATLRKIALPLDNGKYPYVKTYYELTDDRWFSHRGLPELIEDLVKEIDTQECQKLDAMTMRNTPMITYRSGIVNPAHIRPVATQAIPRHEADDIVMLQNTNLNADFSVEREQMRLESKIEELVGQIDFSLQSQINRRQPRTLGEVEMQQQNMQMVFSLDADLFTEQFSDLFSFVWDLWCQYGNDKEEFAYFGENGWENIRLTKEEVQGRYKIVVRGNDQNFNPTQRMQKAQMLLQLASNPVALQSGIIQPINLYNAYKNTLKTLDVYNWDEFITDPAKLPPPPQPPPAVQIGMENLTPAEQIQVKASQGIKPDVQGMMLQKQEELKQQEIENAPEPETLDPNID